MYSPGYGSCLMCMCACVRACVHACVRACVRVCVCVCVCVCVFPWFLPPLAIRCACNKRYLRLQPDMGNTFIIVFSLIVHTYMLYMCLHASMYNYVCICVCVPMCM